MLPTSLDRAAVAAALPVAALAAFVTKLLVGPRHPTLRPEVQLSKWTLKGFLIGHFVDVNDSWYGNAWSAQRHWCRDLHRAALIRVGSGPFLFTANPEDYEYITVKNAGNFVKDPGYDILKRLLGVGLVTIKDNAKHALHRREAAPAFSPDALKTIVNECFPQHATALLNEMKSLAKAGKPVEIEEPVRVAAMRIVAQAAFKTSDLKTLDKVEAAYLRAIKAVWSFLRLNKVIDSALVFQNRAVRQARAEMRPVVDEVAAKALQEGLREGDSTAMGTATESTHMKALIDYLLKSQYLTKDDIFDHSITFLFAGFDTTASGLTWMIYHMATHVDIQDRLYEELGSAFALGTVPTLETLAGCRYLFNCIRESLRYTAPILAVGREALTDDVLPGTKTFVPAGYVIAASMEAMQTHPAIWGPDAREYVPERWERPGAEDLAERAFAPFSWGKRNCIGKDFALNEMKVLGAILFRNFRFIWPEGAPEPAAAATPVLKPIVPFKVTVVARTA